MIVDIGMKAEIISRFYLQEVSNQLRKHRVKDINPVQTTILFKLGNQEISVRELDIKGIYLGTNPSYNLHEMRDHGYVDYGDQPNDARVKLIKLSAKGLSLHDQLFPIFDVRTAVTTDYYHWLCGMEKFLNKWSYSNALADE